MTTAARSDSHPYRDVHEVDPDGWGGACCPPVPLLGAQREIEGCARDAASHQDKQNHRTDQRLALVRLCGGSRFRR
jgi:hypothetical protein